MCRIWLTARPKSQAGVELRQIVNQLHTLKDHQQRDYWIVSLVKWHKQYETYLKEKSFSSQTGRFWYKHKLLRRSFTVIRRALPDMFHYLDNSKIPKTTNGLESFFGHLKSHITIHRGLSKEHRRNFIKWYLYFKNEWVFLAIKHTDKEKRSVLKETLRLSFMRQSYCWQVALQQCLLPLLNDLSILRLILLKNTNHFWHHYLNMLSLQLRTVLIFKMSNTLFTSSIFKRLWE